MDTDLNQLPDILTSLKNYYIFFLSPLNYLVTIRCGMQTSENCTYFESQGTEDGSCTANICRINSNVCQLRLDFNRFTVSGPDAGTLTTTKLLNGVPATSINSIPSRPATQCLTDAFVVTNPNGRSPAPLCGINTGEHCEQACRLHSISYSQVNFEI